MNTNSRQSLKVILWAATFVALCARAMAETNPPQSTPAIPFTEIGAKATADYKGDAIGIVATADGARLHTAFQKLSGTVTSDGLRLDSTAEKGGSLKLTSTAIARSSTIRHFAFDIRHSLPLTGTVTTTGKLVTFTRPGIIEEYSVSVDGIRQDFIIMKPPVGGGALSVLLNITGATAEVSADGVKLTLNRSGRAIAYSRLRVTDATGKELVARLEVPALNRLALRVEDATAIYPVRIDPTFSDADWVSINHGMAGVNGSVNAIVVDGSGNLYVGGTFTFAGKVVANRIAKWNGSDWSALDTGMDGTVNALALSGGDLYAGGSFITAGGTTANRIAKWDGSSWSPLGTGMNGPVNALVVSGGDLYAGGNFGTAGGTAANRIAKWDGSAWSALGTGMSSTVLALAVSGGDLYAGGSFTTAGGVTVNRICQMGRQRVVGPRLGDGRHRLCPCGEWQRHLRRGQLRHGGRHDG